PGHRRRRSIHDDGGTAPRRDAAGLRQGVWQGSRRRLHAGAAERIADDVYAEREAVRRGGGQRRTLFGRVHRLRAARERKQAVKLGVAAVALVGLAAGALHARQESPSAPAELPRSVWGGAYTEAQAKRGEAVYRQECASCHGTALSGGEEAGALAGPVFTA